MGRLHSLGAWWGAALLGLSQRWVIGQAPLVFPGVLVSSLQKQHLVWL